MNGGNGREHADREALRERLSAYLDGELAPGDTATLERHLASCAECRDELASLREMRALLRALPQPALPRSFALPPTAATDRSSAARTPAPRQPTPVRTQRPAASATVPRLARAVQWVGGLAACFGLLLILATAVLGGSPGQPSSAAGPALSGARTPMHTSSAPQQTATAIAPSPGSPQGIGQATHTAAPTAPVAPGTAAGPEPASASARPFPVLPATGVGLLAGGIVLLGAGSVAARRRQHPTRRAR